MPKFKVGDLVKFIYGSGWGTKTQLGIVVELRDRGMEGQRLGERFSYQCYGQNTGHYYWPYEREMVFPEEEFGKPNS